MTKVGKYTIISKIGEGGMGAIFMAKHPTLNKKVILKQLKLRGNLAFAQRFKREASIVFDFRNDHIVQVYDHFKEGSSYYIVMEYVDGIALDALIKKKRYLTNEAAMLICREICKGLKYAHDNNVIHRDIKPGNVLISKDGEVKLTDFGIATSEDIEDGLTREGMTLGTPAYMSPEQIDNSKTVDKRADIYSIGVVLYEMVTGQVPFSGSFTPEAITSIYKGQFTLPREINPRILPVIQNIIKKLIQPKVKKRYKDIEIVIIRLSRYLKKYKDKNTVNNAIKNYIQDDRLEVEEKVSKKAAKTRGEKTISKLTANFSSIVFGIIVFVLLLGVSLFYCYQKGLYYEYFKEEEYGALRIAVRFPKKYKEPDNINIKASLLKRQGKRKRFGIVKDFKFNFKKNNEKETKKYYYLDSQKLYLNPDHYRVQISAGNKQHYEDFFLNPRIVQKKYKDSYKEKIILLNLKSYRQVLPLKINFQVKNIADNSDITKDVKIALYSSRYRRWWKWKKIAWNKNLKKLITTGSKYTFVFSRKGFYTKNITLFVKHNETTLNLPVNLTPIPGRLYLRSNYEGLDVLLNNSYYYISGRFDRKYKKFTPTTRKRQRVYLAPGEYVLTVKKNDTIYKNEKIKIKSNKPANVYIYYNDKNQKLILKIGAK